MPLVKPTFQPGIIKTNTALDAEGFFTDGNFVRFWQGRAEPIGGWSLSVVQTFEGTARGSKAWRTLDGVTVIAFGTESNLYGLINGFIRDITPALIRSTEEDTFSTISGSDVVGVLLPFHRLREGDAVTFANHQTTVGGLTIEGAYTVEEVLTRDRFTIKAASNASADVNDGGGFVDVSIPIPPGSPTAPLTGYGSGAYGAGEYGVSPSTDPINTWAVDNWGENGLFNFSGYGLFEWQPSQSYADLAFNGDFASADGWGLGTGWGITGGEAVKTAGVASNLSQDIEGILEPGRVYEIVFGVTRAAGSLKFRVNVGGSSPAVIDVGDASSPITKSGTYSRLFRCPADPLDIVFEADADFAGAVTSVEYRLFDKAYRLITAPARIDSMFVDPKGVVVALGATQVDGTYSPTVVRNSDIRNNRSWVPDAGSVASEYALRGGGGQLMAGLATRQQNLIWGDNGVFSAQYKGEAGDAYDIELLSTGCGLISRHAAAGASGFVFWMSNSGQFYIFRGVGATSLGTPEVIACTLREDVFDNLDDQQRLKIHAGVNSQFSEVWWFYPDKRDGDEVSRAVAFNWMDGPWSTHKLARTSWIDAGPLSSPVAFSTDRFIYLHEHGNTANGAGMNAYVETAYFDRADGDAFTAILGIVPDFARQKGSVNFRVRTKIYPNGPEKVSPALQASPAKERINYRQTGRQMSLRIENDSTDCFWRMGALRLDVVPDRARR